MMPKIPRARRKRQWGVRGHRSPTSHFSLHSLSISLFSSHELCRKPVIQKVCTLHHAAVSAYLNLNSFTLHWQLRNYNFVRRVAFPCPTSQKKIYLTPLIGSRLHRRYAFDPTKQLSAVQFEFSQLLLVARQCLATLILRNEWPMPLSRLEID